MQNRIKSKLKGKYDVAIPQKRVLPFCVLACHYVVVGHFSQKDRLSKLI